MEPARLTDVASGVDELDTVTTGVSGAADHVAFECGYCRPGTVCSAAGMPETFRASSLGHVTDDLEALLQGYDADDMADVRARSLPVLLNALLGL